MFLPQLLPLFSFRVICSLYGVVTLSLCYMELLLFFFYYVIWSCHSFTLTMLSRAVTLSLSLCGLELSRFQSHYVVWSCHFPFAELLFISTPAVHILSLCIYVPNRMTLKLLPNLKLLEDVTDRSRHRICLYVLHHLLV